MQTTATDFWTFLSASELVFGCGSIARLGRLTSQLGLRRVYVVTDTALESAGIVARACAPLKEAGITVEVFLGGEAEPSLNVIELCHTEAQAFEPDAVIGLGGGSNMDLSKCVALLLSHGGQMSDYFGANHVPGPVLPLICVPTTAGTGSEVSGAAVLTDTDNDIKVSTLSDFLRPRLALVDPDLTLTCPKRVTAESGIDALTHAIEARTATHNTDLELDVMQEDLPPYFGRHPLGDALAEKAIELVGQHLVKAVDDPQDIKAREGMALAATLAGMAFSNCGVALVHALEYPVGGAVHCSHGAGNGLLLPHVMRFNLPERPAELARIAQLLGQDISGKSETAAAEAALSAVEQLQQQIGIPQRLRDFGAREDQLPLFAEKAFQIKRLLATNPRRATQQDLLKIYQAAL